jgi:hypothetical protein
MGRAIDGTSSLPPPAATGGPRQGPAWRARPARVVALAIAAALLASGLAGGLSDAAGFALLFLATAILGTGLVCGAVLVFTRAGDGPRLAGAMQLLLRIGGWCYVLAVAALAGHYVHETLAGRMELRWILFGPAVLAALITVDRGLYRKIWLRNLPTWQRFRAHITRAASEPGVMRRTLVDEVVVQRTLLAQSGVRWLRHMLIFWGFAAMMGVEFLAVIVREGFPAFGWSDLWRTPGHPVRSAFDFAFDLTGVMILAGCLLALAWRWRVNGTPEQRYSDTPTTLFLLAVVASGFAVEALRLAAAPGSHPWSFAGTALATALPPGVAAGGFMHEALWIVHALGSVAFIAYVPVKRLVHSCATPLGRLANSQKAMLAAKKNAVLSGLLVRKDSR